MGNNIWAHHTTNRNTNTNASEKMMRTNQSLWQKPKQMRNNKKNDEHTLPKEKKKMRKKGNRAKSV